VIHLHRWTKWKASGHYIDVSWGGYAWSTQVVKRCTRCGMVRSKGLYGVDLPLEEGADAKAAER
jgi:hypothetical protein